LKTGPNIFGFSCRFGGRYATEVVVLPDDTFPGVCFRRGLRWWNFANATASAIPSASAGNFHYYDLPAGIPVNPAKPDVDGHDADRVGDCLGRKYCGSRCERNEFRQCT